LGKFLLLKAVIQQAPFDTAYLWLAGVTLAGVVISLYYYFGVLRAIYWAKQPEDLSAIPVSTPMKCSLVVSIAGMLYLGIFPGMVWDTAAEAVKALKF